MAHHLFCLQGYEDFGYDENFVKNFRKVVDEIKDDAECIVQIVDVCDSICSKCPFIEKDNTCTKRDMKKIRMEENKLADFLGLTIGENYKIHDLLDLVNAKITSKEMANSFYCRECNWRSICTWYKSKF